MYKIVRQPIGSQFIDTITINYTRYVCFESLQQLIGCTELRLRNYLRKENQPVIFIERRGYLKATWNVEREVTDIIRKMALIRPYLPKARDLSNELELFSKVLK